MVNMPFLYNLLVTSHFKLICKTKEDWKENKFWKTIKIDDKLSAKISVLLSNRGVY